MAIISGFLGLAVALVFCQTLQHDFVYDDYQYITENSQVIRGLTARGFAWAFSSGYANNWHPLTWLSHMLDCQLYGLNAGGHHLSNVLLHAANAFFLFLVLWRLTGDLCPCAFVAAVFAIHPLRVESVAWVAERKDVLSGLFFMLTLLAYIAYVRHCFSLIRYLTVALVFALGLMAKPILVTLPLLLLLLDYWPLGRFQTKYMWLLVEKIPLLALAAASCTATLIAQRQSVVALDDASLSSRISNALVSYAIYLGQIFYPAGLAVFYPRLGGDLPAWQIAGAAIILTFISLATIVWRRRRPWLFVGWFWFLVTLVPVIGLVQVGDQAMADRYTYLAQIGLYLAIAYEALQVVASWRSRRLCCGVAATLALVILMGCAWRQTTYWRDSESLWGRALACTSENAIAHCKFGSALERRGKSNAAIVHFQQALKIDPHSSESQYNLGDALARRGDADNAIIHYQKALETNPTFTVVYNKLGIAYANRGQFDAAIAYYRQALKIDPRFLEAHYNLGNALLSRGDADNAITHYRQALEINPQFAPAHNNLGVALAKRGQIDEAIVHYRQSLEVAPNSAQTHNNLGEALARRGAIEEAIAHYRKSLHINPDSADTCNNLAWALATCSQASLRRGSEAIAIAQRAIQLTEARDPVTLDTLAAAYAEAGHFSQALETATRAVSLATDRGDSATADAYRARIKLYQAGVPYRETFNPQQKKN